MDEDKYYTYEEIKKKINAGSGIKKYYLRWANQLEDAFDYLDQEKYYEETPDFDNPADFDDVKSLVHDMVKTLKLLVKHIDMTDNEHLRELMSKIAAYGLLGNRIDVAESDLVELLDFIDWDADLLFTHQEEWAMCEEDSGYNIVTLMEFAKKHGKKIRKYRTSRIVYCLLMAVSHCQDADAEKFIIKHKIKLTTALEKDGDDGMISEMTDYFEEEHGYNLKKN